MVDSQQSDKDLVLVKFEKRVSYAKGSTIDVEILDLISKQPVTDRFTFLFFDNIQVGRSNNDGKYQVYLNYSNSETRKLVINAFAPEYENTQSSKLKFRSGYNYAITIFLRPID